ncbi:MAG: hypothetical protein AB2697_21735 [Candidatus Thiodiazotropha endolucinida]
MYDVNVSSLTGLPLGRVPNELYREGNGTWGGYTTSEHLSNLTGCNPSSGAIFDPTSLGALVGRNGKGVKYRIIDTIENDQDRFEFVNRISEDGYSTVYATYPNSWTRAWNEREQEIKMGRKKRVTEYLFPYITSVSSGDLT